MRIVDVRSHGEYESVWVLGSELIPLDQLDPEVWGAAAPDASEKVYLMCQAGGRATKAAQKLSAAGVAGCVVVEGGMDAWVAAGLPVERGSSGVLPLMRQVQIVVGLITATGAALAHYVNPWFGVIPLFMGCGLIFAGVTGFCGLALILARMPWNRGSGEKKAGASCCSGGK